MAGFSSWIDSHFNLIQAISIIGTLLIGIVTIRHALIEREEKNRSTLKEQHNNLWSQVAQRDDLKRILSPEVNLKDAPVTLVEEEYLNLVFVHFEEGWRLAKQGSANNLNTLATDQGNFTALPIPHDVWKRTKITRNQKFVQFVERALEGRGR